MIAIAYSLADSLKYQKEKAQKQNSRRNAQIQAMAKKKQILIKANHQPTPKQNAEDDDEWIKRLNEQNQKTDNPNVYSSKESSNNPNNDAPNDFNYKSNNLHNPNKDVNSIDPPLETNTTPPQLTTQISEQLEGQGIPTLWQQAFPCPCLDSDNHPKSNCPICHGLGWAFRQPVELSVAYQADNRGTYNGAYGNEETGMAIATPEMTENGRECGIKPGDRLDAEGFTTAQVFMVHISKDAINRSAYIPYNVYSIDLAVTMDKNSNVIKLNEGQDFTFNKNTSKFKPAKKWLDHSISLVLTTSIRFIVSNVLKDTRYSYQDKPNAKDQIIGSSKPNRILTGYMRRWKGIKKGGPVFFRMPKKLAVRREDVFLPQLDFENGDSNKRNDNYLDKASHNVNNPLSPLNLK